MTKKGKYLTSEELAKALEESQKLGQPTVEVCQCFLKIAEHFVKGARYCRYSQQMKEDMISHALLKCVKSIKNFKKERAASCFSYYTRCVETAIWAFLSNHYKQCNIQRALARDIADLLQETNPQAAQQLRDSLLKEDTTHTLDEDEEEEL